MRKYIIATITVIIIIFAGCSNFQLAIKMADESKLEDKKIENEDSYEHRYPYPKRVRLINFADNGWCKNLIEFNDEERNDTIGWKYRLSRNYTFKNVDPPDEIEIKEIVVSEKDPLIPGESVIGISGELTSAFYQLVLFTPLEEPKKTSENLLYEWKSDSVEIGPNIIETFKNNGLLIDINGVDAINTMICLLGDPVNIVFEFKNEYKQSAFFGTIIDSPVGQWRYFTLGNPMYWINQTRTNANIGIFALHKIYISSIEDSLKGRHQEMYYLDDEQKAEYDKNHPYKLESHNINLLIKDIAVSYYEED